MRCLEADGSSLCFNEANGTLAYEVQTVSVGLHLGKRACSYSDYQKFGDHLVARSYACTEDRQPTIEARIVDLAADPTPCPGAVPTAGRGKRIGKLFWCHPTSRTGQQRGTCLQADVAFRNRERRVEHYGCTDGKPKDLKVSSTTNLELDRLALDAVRQWRFKPARCDGEPVEETIAVDLEFHSN